MILRLFPNNSMARVPSKSNDMAHIEDYHCPACYSSSLFWLRSFENQHFFCDPVFDQDATDSNTRSRIYLPRPKATNSISPPAAPITVSPRGHGRHRSTGIIDHSVVVAFAYSPTSFMSASSGIQVRQVFPNWGSGMARRFHPGERIVWTPYGKREMFGSELFTDDP